MKKTILLIATWVFLQNIYAQNLLTSLKEGDLTIGGYVDAYYGYDFNEPRNQERAYFVSMARHNEMTVNLAYLSFRYEAANIRAVFTPAVGTYMNANYAAESLTLKNILEGYAGVKLGRNVWVDAGVFGSPYTNEGPISKDQLMYSRSFAPEYVPYYLSGLRAQIPMGEKWKFTLYLLNGWQLIQDNNTGKSLGTQLEWKPSEKVLINWNTYIGEENSATRPDFRNRYFTDLYTVINPEGKFSATACVYVGVQERKDTLQNRLENDIWFNANVIGRYRFTEKLSLSGRIEYFDDPKSVQISPVTAANGVQGFTTYSAGLCLNIQAAENALIRFEGRTFWADKNVYLDAKQAPTNQSNLLIAGFTVWF